MKMIGFHTAKQVWKLASLLALVPIFVLLTSACGDDDDDDNVDDEEPEGHGDDFCSHAPEYDECKAACSDECYIEADACFTDECGGLFEDRCDNPGDNNLVPTAPEFEEYCQCVTDCHQEHYFPCTEECNSECEEQYPCE